MPAVPFSVPDGRELPKVTKEVRTFARLLGTVPVVRGQKNHPAIRPMLRSFRNINRAMAKRDAKGWVRLSDQARVAREFNKIADAMLIWPKRAKTKR
jgi:hypothetical protein